jgi:hypothetical protein
MGSDLEQKHFHNGHYHMSTWADGHHRFLLMFYFKRKMGTSVAIASERSSAV